MNNGRLWGSITATLLSVLGVSVLGLSVQSCSVPEKCDALDDCGGNVLIGATSDFALSDGLVDVEYMAYGAKVDANGTVIREPDECQDELFTPPQQATLLNQPAHLANESPIERSSADWCQNLVIKSDRTIKRVNLWFPEIPLRDARLTFSAPNENSVAGYYQIQFNYFRRMQADFPKQCMQAQGVIMKCDEFSRAMKKVLETEPNVSKVVCVDGPQEGCSCVYDMLLVTGVTGPWRHKPDSSLIVYYDDLGAVPAAADYCVKNGGGDIDMTGHDRTTLWNQTGLRTLKLERSTCSDGKLNQGEFGVDCGGPCATDCCSDGTKDADEEGIDCGGLACANNCCSNNTLDADETGIDCGGAICRTGCADGIGCLSGSDCTSGVCAGGLCQMATCMDTVRNGNETDIDCGGACTLKCPDDATCLVGTDCEHGVCSVDLTCTPLP